MKNVTKQTTINQASPGEKDFAAKPSLTRRIAKACSVIGVIALAVSSIARTHAASVSFSQPVPNDRAYLTCLIGNFEEPSRIHKWKVHLRSGSTAVENVSLTVAATTVNTAESGGVKATVTDEAGVQTMTVAYPATQNDNVGNLNLRLKGGQIYELAIERVLPPTGDGAHHYKIGSTDQRLELGWGDPVRYLEHEEQAWTINADANENVQVSVFTDPMPATAPQANSVTVSLRRPDGSIVTGPFTFNPNGVLSVPNYPGGALIVMIERADGHFRIRKESGSDNGVYAMACPDKPPVANCRDVLVFTGPHSTSCQVPASIDNGSFDPEGETLTLRQDPPGPYPVGTTLVTLTVTDHHGQSAMCSAKVTVIDNTPPTIQCPADILKGTDPGQCSSVVNYKPFAMDNCSGIFLFCNPPSGSTFPKGTTTVTCTAIDASGNKATCSFTVTVRDMEAPFADCMPTTNPSGKQIPTAGENPKSGQNPDGFYELGGGDNCDAIEAIAIYIKDSASDFVAGPFKIGDKVKITQAPGVTPNQKKMAGVVVAHIELKGDALVYGIDSSGNASNPHACLVPPKPK